MTDRNAEFEYRRSALIIEQVGLTVRTLFVVAGVVLIGYLASGSVTAVVAQLVGKRTEANIVLDLLGELKVSVGLAWSAAAGGVLYGWRQNQARKSDIRRLTSRIQHLEAKIDPRRSSSHLSPDGSTNPGDA